MDNGIVSSIFPSMNSQQYRLQIYQDWVSCSNKGCDAKEFCELKDVSESDFTSIVREFQSLDPNGEKWGKIKV